MARRWLLRARGVIVNDFIWVIAWAGVLKLHRNALAQWLGRHVEVLECISMIVVI